MVDHAPDAPIALLASPVRRAIVDALADLRRDPEVQDPWPDEPGLTAAQLAELLELHVTTVRFHLDRLVAAGMLRSRFDRQGVGRPRKVYAVEPGALDQRSPGRGYRLLAGLLAHHLVPPPGKPAPTPYQAGRSWADEHVKPPEDATPAQTPGAWLGKVGRMVDVLTDWGYTPRVSTSGQGRTVEVTLVDCPVLDLAREQPAVVCGVHRGLIAGTMSRLGEDDVSVGLVPFVDPDTCLAQVTTHTPFHGQERT